MDSFVEPMNKNVLRKRREPVNADKWWWVGVGMTALGGIGYFFFDKCGRGIIDEQYAAHLVS